jgi:hypothetical protein
VCAADEIVLVLAQYAIALEKFRSDHVALVNGQWRWSVDDSVISTTIPNNHVARRHGKSKTINRPPRAMSYLKRFALAEPMLDSIYGEMKELSKKSPDGPLNKLKVKMINRVLTDLKAALGNEPSAVYLDFFGRRGASIEQRRVLILSQYSAACARFRSNNHLALEG